MPFADDRGRRVTRLAGVFDADGNVVPEAQCWRSTTMPVTVPPAFADVSGAERQTLAGTWLFGGMLYGHFGHFLCESTARLWALDHIGTKIDGVLFFPKQQFGLQRRTVVPLLPLLAATGCTHPVRTTISPTLVERLIVPEQGFGIGEMIAGTAEFRAFADRHFGTGIAPDGPEKIYISRSRLYSLRGRMLGEVYLDRAFESEGYRVFHPQEHPVTGQIAQYKAARTVVSADSSALHLAAFFSRPGDRIGILRRRPGEAMTDFITQYRSFRGIEPVEFDFIDGLFADERALKNVTADVYSRVDYEGLRHALIREGFISESADDEFPPEVEIADELARYEAKLGQPLLRSSLSAA